MRMFTLLYVTVSAVYCGLPPPVDNGQINFASSVFYEGKVNYTCFAGFTLSHTGFVECQASGEWTAAPTCDGTLLENLWSSHSIIENLCVGNAFAVFMLSTDFVVGQAASVLTIALTCEGTSHQKISVSMDNGILTLKVLVTTIDAQWERMGDEGSARYELALLPPCPTIRVLRYSN